MQIQKAKRTRAKIRVGLFAAAGAGKTMSSLKLAKGLTGDWEKVIIICTERGSANLYSHLGPYSVLPLEAPFTPERYIQAIDMCERAGFEAIIIDSITHEWNGKGGCIEIADKSNAKNDFAKWKEVTPRHNAFIDRILQSSAHMICCGRSKDDVELVKNDKGKLEPQKQGLKAITRDGFDFEMTICWDLDKFHNALCSKDRTGIFDGKPGEVITEETGKNILEWLNDAPEQEKPVVLPEEPKTDDAATALKAAINTERVKRQLDWQQVFAIAGKKLKPESSITDMQEVLNALLNYAA